MIPGPRALLRGWRLARTAPLVLSLAGATAYARQQRILMNIKAACRNARPYFAHRNAVKVRSRG